jgi:multidrug efflux pump subunit AcrA (membrane-fusion protein)
MKNRIVFLAVLCLLLGGFGTKVWLSRGLDAAQSDSSCHGVRVRKDRFVRSLVVSGELAAVRSVRIGAPAFRGRGPFAIKMLAPEGSHVEPGDLLCQIDNSTFVSTLQTENLNLEKAENDLVKKKAELEIQTKDLEIQLGQNKLELDKTQLKAEIEKSLLSLRDWQDYQFAYQKAKKEYEKTSKSLELAGKAAREEVALLKLKRDQTAEKIVRLNADIAALDIRADRPGTVLYEIFPPSRWGGEVPRKIQVGDQIFWGWTILSLPDLKEMEVRAYVSEVDGGLLRPGQRARIVVDSYPGVEFGGTLTYVPELAERLGKASNVRTFTSIVKLDQTNTETMRPGMSVRVEVLLDEEEGLVLPRRAVSEENGKFYIKTPQGARTEIRIRARNAVWCLVEGLPEGTEVRN